MNPPKRSELIMCAPEPDFKRLSKELRRNSSCSSLSSLSSWEDIPTKVYNDLERYRKSTNSPSDKRELSPRTLKMLKDGMIPRPKLQRQVAGVINDLDLSF